MKESHTMMIKCAKCGHENQMGSIFCRGCGEKINMDDLDPATLQSEASKAKKKGAGGRLVRNTISTLVFLIVVILIAAVFAPFGHPAYVSPADEELKKAELKLEGYETIVAMPRTKSPLVVTFSPEELNSLYEKRFFGSKDEKDKDKEDSKQTSGAYTIDNVSFAINDDVMTITLYTHLSGTLPVVFTLIGTPVKLDNSGNIGFEIKTAKAGHLPIPSFGTEFISDKFKALTSPQEVKDIVGRASKMEIKDGNVVLTIPKKKEDK